MSRTGTWGGISTSTNGSFLASARNEDWSEETWQEELYTTLAHELTHHIEGLANAHGLDDKDEEQLLQLLEEYRREP